MKKFSLIVLFCGYIALCFGQVKTPGINWVQRHHDNFDVFFTQKDSVEINSIESMIDREQKTVTGYFGQPFKHKFSVYIFPARHDLDLQWQRDYNDTTIRSECWMVASGVSDVLQILSPQTWKSEACEHNPADSSATLKLITHELVHVYHGQYNPIHDFTGLDSLAWFIEGVATYVSGQLDETRMQQVKELIAEEKNPNQLKLFWTGEARYALAGSMVQYIALHYGKKKIFELLNETDEKKMLQSLKTNEAALIAQWKKSLK